jgi:formate-dependent nitrite reductase cytochrome c552 subunit
MTAPTLDPTQGMTTRPPRRTKMAARSRTSPLERWLRAIVIVACAVVLVMVTVEGVAAESPSPAVDSSPAATETAAPTVEPTAEPQASLEPAEGDTCYECHVRVDGEQHTISDQWFNSVHGQNGVSCAECHGGDPTSDKVTVAMDPANGFRGVPDRRDTVQLCGTCHSDVDRMRQYQIPTDQYAKYRASVHGQKLNSQNDVRVAICTDCHGDHDVQKASDPTSKVYPLNVPDLCASCHSDADYMQT